MMYFVKKIGLVGGIAWLSTADYYSGLCKLSERYHRELGLDEPLPTPEMTIESLDLRKAVARLGVANDEPSWRAFDEYHRAALKRLAASEVQVAAIASNTPHCRFDQITTGIDICVVNLFEAVAAECARQYVARAVILGTKLTMMSSTLPAMLATYGIEAIVPETQTQDRVAGLIGRLQRGLVSGELKEIHDIVQSVCGHRGTNGAAVCLCCTELPLAFTGQRFEDSFVDRGVLFVNSAAVHVSSIFQASL